MRDALRQDLQISGAVSAQLSDQNYRTLIELCPDALIVHDGETIVLANEAMAALIGLASSKEIVGRLVLDVIASSSQAFVQERIRQLNPASSTLYDEIWRRGDGSEVTVEVSARHMPWVAPHAAMVIVRDVTERRRLEEERENLLAEKELLMREVHHRAANSLQLVRSLLNLQARSAEGEEIRHQLWQASARIGTVSCLHSRLQKESSAVEGDAQAYMEGVIADLRAALGEAPARPIVLECCEAGTLTLKADLLVALGLIVAEAVTNSIKHGAGPIKVQLVKGDAGLEIAVEDEGKGFPKGFDPTRGGSGLGMRLVASLIQARGGRIMIGEGFQGEKAVPSRIAAMIPLEENGRAEAP